jgi:hypothetical protein
LTTAVVTRTLHYTYSTCLVYHWNTMVYFPLYCIQPSCMLRPELPSNRGSIPGSGKGRHRFWDPLRLLFSAYQGILHRSWWDQGVKLIKGVKTGAEADPSPWVKDTGLLSRQYTDRKVYLTIHFHLMPWLKSVTLYLSPLLLLHTCSLCAACSEVRLWINPKLNSKCPFWKRFIVQNIAAVREIYMTFKLHLSFDTFWFCVVCDVCRAVGFAPVCICKKRLSWPVMYAEWQRACLENVYCIGVLFSVRCVLPSIIDCKNDNSLALKTLKWCYSSSFSQRM